MSDRLDPSQFQFTAGPADGFAALPDTSPDEDQIQYRAEGVYATPAEMTGPVDHGDVPDLMHERPGRYFTQAPARQRIVSVARPFSPAGGLLVPGAGLLGGWSIAADASGPALLRIHDGYDAGSPVLAHVAVAVSTSTNHAAPIGVRYSRGLFIEVVSGIVAGTLHTLETEDAPPVAGGLM